MLARSDAGVVEGVVDHAGQAQNDVNLVHRFANGARGGSMGQVVAPLRAEQNDHAPKAGPQAQDEGPLAVAFAVVPGQHAPPDPLVGGYGLGETHLERRAEELPDGLPFGWESHGITSLERAKAISFIIQTDFLR